MLFRSGNNRSSAFGEYRFKVQYSSGADQIYEDKAYIDMRRSEEGWSLLGTYNFQKDTAKVILSNDFEMRTVTADAVKIVRR